MSAVISEGRTSTAPEAMTKILAESIDDSSPLHTKYTHDGEFWPVVIKDFGKAAVFNKRVHQQCTGFIFSVSLRGFLCSFYSPGLLFTNIVLQRIFCLHILLQDKHIIFQCFPYHFSVFSIYFCNNLDFFIFMNFAPHIV